MSVGADTLIIRGGLMKVDNVKANIADVVHHYGRPGICLKVLIDDLIELTDPRLVSNPRVCLSTITLLAEASLDPGQLQATNDLGDRYQCTLWLPDQPTDTLDMMVRRAFRGPLQKGDVSRAWKTEDLRRLQHPPP